MKGPEPSEYRRKDVMKTAFFFITGTSGSGKSTLEKTLRQQLNSELFAVYDFDEKGVPINADQVWRQKTTQFWLEKGIEHDRLGQYMILCGAVQPSEVLALIEAMKWQGRLYFGFLKIEDSLIRQRLQKRLWEAPLIENNINWARLLEEEVRQAEDHKVFKADTPEE
jgi:hypothetical protein